ncbi:MAG TPA: ribosome biogenesis GTPase Der [Candidatus Limnocylindrales bacterium]|nr:ribosome biogenesis GTPase Der [Candidatus Limnocylindrales bacterium]
MPIRRKSRPTKSRLEDAPTEGLPVVAFVGRPNVGKSTLFNRVIGDRVAIVEDRARTTRDRLYDVGEWNGRRFIVIDTGGLENRPGDAIEERVQEQARLAIDEADVIVFVVDAETGPTPADQEANELLRTSTAPVIVAANKSDNPKREFQAAEFHQFGWPEIHPISALHGRGVADLLDVVVWALPAEAETELARKRKEEEAAAAAEPWPDSRGKVEDDEGADDAAFAMDDRPVRIAIIGRPNVGKSSLLNALMGQERAIVSDIAGTTRDAIDTSFEWAGRTIRLVDTAGIKRRGKVAGGPAAERFATLRALKAVTRSDVSVLVVDAQDGLTAQDDHVAGYALEEGTGLVIAINKWDVVEKDEHTFDEYAAEIRQEAPFLDVAPIVAISAKTGQRVGRVLEAALEIAAERRRRVPTAALTAWLREATLRRPAPNVRGKQPRFFYATQVSIEPPTFVLFASEASTLHFSYKRFLENQLRDAFGFAGTPIRLVIRERTREEGRGRPRAGTKRKAPGAPRGKTSSTRRVSSSGRR